MTELAPMEAFTERLKAKLRDDIGNMLPDDVIAGMVQKVVNDEFFTKRSVRNRPDDWRDTSLREEPTPFQKAVIEASKPIIQAHVSHILAERAEEIDRQIEEMVSQGFSRMVLRAIDSTLQSALSQHEWKIQDFLQRLAGPR